VKQCLIVEASVTEALKFTFTFSGEVRDGVEQELHLPPRIADCLLVGSLY